MRDCCCCCSGIIFSLINDGDGVPAARRIMRWHFTVVYGVTAINALAPAQSTPFQRVFIFGYYYDYFFFFFHTATRSPLRTGTLITISADAAEDITRIIILIFYAPPPSRNTPTPLLLLAVRGEPKRFSQDGMTNNGATGTRRTHVAAATEKHSSFHNKRSVLPYTHTHSYAHIFTRDDGGGGGGFT